MIHGSECLVKADNEIVALQTDCEFSAEVEMVEVVPLPGSADDDGWGHFEAGGRSWGLNNESFLTTSDKVVSNGINGKKVDLVLLVADAEIRGKAVVSSVEIDAQHKNYSRVKMQMRGEEWPEVR